MSSKGSNALSSTIQDIFAQSDQSLQPNKIQTRKQGSAKGQLGPSKRDLELAVTILLVDLASCDQSFDPEEYHVITHGLMRLFGTGKTEVTALVNQAQTTLKNMRGVGRFGKLLKDSLSDKDKQAIMDVIEDVIAADGEEDGFEIYLRHKFADLLGHELKPAQPSEE